MNVPADREAPVAAPRRGPARVLAEGLAVAVAAVIVPLVLLEIGFRLFAPQPTALNVSQWDAEYGWRNHPGARGFFRTREFRMEVRIDSLGLRDDETTWAKPPGTYRILGLGDSFGFGHGVAVDSCFFTIAERELDARSHAAGGPRVEVVNSSVGKWGTTAEYLYLKKEGVRFSPNAIVLAFCVDNDFENNADCNVLRLEGGHLVHVDNPEPTVRKAQNITRFIPGYPFLAEHSHVINFIRIRASQLDYNIISRRRALASEAAVPVKEAEPAWHSLRLPITLMLMDSLVDVARGAHAPLLALFVPTHWQCAPASERTKRYLDPAPQAAMVDRTIAHLDSLGVPVVYPLEAMREANRSRRLYFDEGHLNEAGSRVVAKALIDGLISAGLAPPDTAARASR
jgi:hypothetical protein